MRYFADVRLAIPPPRAQFCGTVPTLQPGPRHPRASKYRYEVSVSTMWSVRGHLRAGSFALCGFLVHAGHMLASLLCRTTSKTVHRCSCTSVLSPNRDNVPTSESGMPSIISPVYALRGSLDSDGPATTGAFSQESTLICGKADNVRVGTGGFE